MPIYEYRCKRDHTFDLLQKRGEGTPKACPQCGSSVVRIFTPVAIHFKGRGFYNTDYGKQSKRPPGLKEGEASPKENKPDPDSSKTSDTNTKKKADG